MHHTSHSYAPRALLCAPTDELLLRQQNRQYNEFRATIEDDVKMFYALQQVQQDDFLSQFKTRFPYDRQLALSYKTALDAVVELEFAHACVAPRLPIHIRAYQEQGERLFAPESMHDLSAQFFAVQHTAAPPRAIDEIIADLRRVEKSYDALGARALKLNRTLVSLNNVGNPAVRILGHALSDVGPQLIYLANAVECARAPYSERKLAEEKAAREAARRLREQESELRQVQA